jgi:hypothetical protein
MRRLRITTGLLASLMMLALAAAPAYAKKEAPKAFFGEFTASVAGKTITPATPQATKGHGEVGELSLGPWDFRCEREIKSKGKVEAERSETFKTLITIAGCEAAVKLKSGVKEWKKVKFSRGFEFQFHANGSAHIGEDESQVEILKTTSVTAKVHGSECKMIIPAQTIPIQAEKKPEQEFESAEYGTEKEATENLKKYPNGFKERLEIFWEFKKVKTEVPVEKPEPGKPAKCEYEKEPEGKYNPETERVDFTNGVFEGELEEIEIKNGELAFDTTPPV